MVQKLLQHTGTEWKSAVIDTPKGRHQKTRYIDSKVKLIDYNGLCRQVAVSGLVRAAPTLFITNNDNITGREVVLKVY